MNRWNVARASFSPKGIRTNSNLLLSTLKAVLGMSAGSISIWRKPLAQSLEDSFKNEWIASFHAALNHIFRSLSWTAHHRTSLASRRTAEATKQHSSPPVGANASCWSIFTTNRGDECLSLVGAGRSEECQFHSPLLVAKWTNQTYTLSYSEWLYLKLKTHTELIETEFNHDRSSRK